jgi:hypothetical protein
MTHNDALAIFNRQLVNYRIEPITEADATDLGLEGMTESQILEAASDFANEERTVKGENKFWAENDWQKD